MTLDDYILKTSERCTYMMQLFGQNQNLEYYITRNQLIVASLLKAMMNMKTEPDQVIIDGLIASLDQLNETLNTFEEFIINPNRFNKWLN